MTPKSADFMTAQISDTSSMYSDDASTVISQRCRHSRNRSNVPSVAYERDICLKPTIYTTKETIGSMVPRQETIAEAEERRRRTAAIARAEANLMAWVEADARSADRQSEWPGIDLLDDEHQYPKLGAVRSVGSRPPTPLRHPLRLSSTTTKSSENIRGTAGTEHGVSKISPFGCLSLRDSDTVHPGSRLLRQSPDTPVAGGVRRCIGRSLHIRTTTRDLLDRPVEERLERQNRNVLQNDGYPPDSQASTDVLIQNFPPFGSFQPCPNRGSASAIYTMPTLSRHQTCSSRSTMRSTPPRSTGGVVSSTGNVYGLGDHSLGYSSGRFVTNVSYDESSNKAPKKSSLRSIFYM
ncbi:hypothetical protein FB567DRAFT_619351 [Paraphoma chrysanthemicola]|uniref:Uncharacterized protein n=1 Tax=Paraphoma chrysanthemicola TaxID=798071 RepID=A0A8K0R9H7_9PLEO|nr:hypothetical protein FB567DRAFT_619351 [Paraphoma chrysanthemicola]